MKAILKIYLLLFGTVVFAQTEVLKRFKPVFKEIIINTYGLDDVLIEVSKSNYLEVVLLDENRNKHIVTVDQDENKTEISFIQNDNIYLEKKDDVFRKFITKRLERAKAIIRVPKKKEVTIYGENVGIISKSYEGTLNIFINKGNIDLQRIIGNTSISIFQGNIKGIVKNTKLNLKTNKGTIKINKKKVNSPHITTDSIKQELKIVSILGNIDIIR